MFGLETNLLELLGQTLGVKTNSTLFLLMVVVAAATALGTGVGLVSSFLGEVGELVGTQQLLTALSHLVKAGVGGSVHSIDDVTALERGLETTLILHVEEEFPTLLGEVLGQHLHIVGTASGVNDLVEVALFLEQDLLVACDTLTEVVALLVRSVKRGDNQ